MFVTEFVDDLEGFFGEAARVLRNRGRLVVGFMDRDSVWGRYSALDLEGTGVFSPPSLWTSSPSSRGSACDTKRPGRPCSARLRTSREWNAHLEASAGELRGGQGREGPAGPGPGGGSCLSPSKNVECRLPESETVDDAR
ncbi:MAG: class I SAM-dependent methyltransferase [Desulfobacterales bacterium]|nr:class I SAM-dependent methyltransferase [Desulfobacterales bacterium]